VTALLATVGGLPSLVWPALDRSGVDAVVTTRSGGVSVGPYASLNLGLHVGDRAEAVVENRRRAAAALGADLGTLVFCEQVHGAGSAVVTRADAGRGTADVADAVAAADALVTTTPGLILVILVADCLPIVLVDPAAGVLGVVHAGWRGTAARAVHAALETMTALGARPGRVVAALGPSVAAHAYEVGPEVAEAIGQAGVGGALDRAAPGGPGKRRGSGDPVSDRWLLDLPRAHELLLAEAGVPANSILRTTGTTGPGGPFFSHRAEGPCGRVGLLARLRTGGPGGARSMGPHREAGRPDGRTAA
jgi:hypothetical protein